MTRPPETSAAGAGARTSGSSRPTLEEVAARAGVSRATVSRVVNKAATVDPGLADRVNLAIEELGYVPNLAARTLMTRRTDTVVLVAAESSTRFFADPFFAAVVRGVSQECARVGLHLVLSVAQDVADVDRVEAFVKGGHVDGALVLSEHDHLDAAGRLGRAGVPVVMGGRPLRPHEGVGYVDHDNHRGGELATRRLLQLGCRHIGTISGPGDMTAAVDRLAGFRQALGDRFDPDLCEEGDFTTAGGAAAAAAILARRPDVDGLFVASDTMAAGALARLRGDGVRVPDDVAVVGFDDSEVASLSSPPLTTVRQHSTTQGRLMAQLLVQRLGRTVPDVMPELEHLSDDGGIVLDVDLVVRGTA